VIDLIETNRLKRVVVKLFLKIGPIVVKSIKTSELLHCQANYARLPSAACLLQAATYAARARHSYRFKP
jgi:hypothetical protein